MTPSRSGVIERDAKVRRRAAAETELRAAKDRAEALVAEVSQQSREAQQALLEMRAAVERAEKRVAELEAAKRAR